MPRPSTTPNFAPAVESFARGFSQGREREEAVERAMDLHVIEAAKANPALWDDPRTKKAAESVYGKDAASVVTEAFKASSDPNHPGYTMLHALGLSTPDEEARAAGKPAEEVAGPPSPTPGVFGSIARGLGTGGYTPPPPKPPVPPDVSGSVAKLVERAPQLPGTEVNLGPKGPTIKVKGKTVKQSDEARFYQAVDARKQELLAQNPDMDDGHATFQATREAAAAADQNKVLVPDKARALANADTEFLIKQRLERMKKDMEEQYAGPIAKARTKGTIAGKEESPIAARDLPNVIDLESGKSVPADTTYAEARKNGAAFMSPKDVEAIHASGIGWEYAEQIHDVGQRLFTSDNPLDALKNGAVAWGQAKLGTNPDAVALATLNKNWLLFVRNSLNEKGNIAARLVEKSGTTFGFVNTQKGFAAKERVMAGLIAASKKARGGQLSPQEQAYVDEVQRNLDIATSEDSRVTAARAQQAPPPAAGSGTTQPSSPPAAPAPAAGESPPAAPVGASQPTAQQRWDALLKSKGE